jgi:hypothetical protein
VTQLADTELAERTMLAARLEARMNELAQAEQAVMQARTNVVLAEGACGFWREQVNARHGITDAHQIEEDGGVSDAP